MQRALVTGAGGFLGRHIVQQLLARGTIVRAFSRGNYPELEALGVECQQGDLRSRDAIARACEGVDTVFHTAAKAGIWGPWSEYYAINVEGTQHVVDACRAQNITKLIYTSSPSVTFAARDQCGIDELTPYAQRWLCHYPHSKAIAEQFVLRANGANRLATCALRPHLIWGKSDPHLIPRLIERARRGQLRRVGRGQNLIDITYVDNAAEAHLLAADRLELNSPIAGKAYFISQGEPVNCWQWINEVLQSADLQPVERAISYRAAWHVGALLEAIHKIAGIASEPRMTRFLAAQLATSHYFDISAARRDFNYEPRVSTREGMAKTFGGTAM